MATRIMHRRARAVRTHDLPAFLADVNRSDPRFLAAQRQLFDNLRQLPLEVFELKPVLASWPTSFADDRWAATAYLPYVEQRMQLRGFDRSPVTTVYGVTFARTGGRWAIVSDGDVSDRLPTGAQDAPWDLTDIRVRSGPRVLAVFDRGSIRSANHILAWTRQSIDAVRRAVPFRWRERVVVYALSDRRTSEAMGRRDAEAAAVAFPVLDNSESPTGVVDVRVLINPDQLSTDRASGIYLLTHEITHVATSRVGLGAPIWFREGLADFVATHGANPAYWGPSPSSTARVLRGVHEMPSSNLFGGTHPDYDYDLSLMACAYIASHHGEQALWRLFSAMRGTDQNPDVAQEAVLRRRLGINSATLARRAARRLLAAASR